MNLGEIVYENFDSTIPIENAYTSHDTFLRYGHLSDKRLVFEAIITQDVSYNTIATISFYERNKERVQPSNMTNAELQMKIFSFIMDCIKDTISRYNPYRIEFFTDYKDADRTKLYRKIVDKVVSSTKFKSRNVTHSNFDDVFIISKDTPITEEYQEDKNSSFTHNGKEYLLNPLLKAAAAFPVIDLPIAVLDWVLKYSKDLGDRDYDKIDIDVPILIGEYEDKLVVLDGLHRLIKSKKLGKKLIPCKYIDDKLLSKVEIDK